MLLETNVDGTCRVTSNSYIMLVVYVISGVIGFICGFWTLYMFYAALRTKIVKANSLTLALVFNIVSTFLVSITILARAVTILSEDQRQFDVVNRMFIIIRVMTPISLFGVLTTLGMSIYLITLQTLQVPIDDRMDQKRKVVSVGVVALFCAVVVPFVAFKNYSLASLIISILIVVCWLPFKRLGRRLRNGFPIAHLPAAYRERSFAVSEHLRLDTNRILHVVYIRLVASIFIAISFYVRSDIDSERLFKHFEAFSDCFNAISAVALAIVLTSCLTVMVRVRMESAMNLQVIAMLVANSPRTEVASVTLMSDHGLVYDVKSKV
jgi:hypothetical protein